MLIVTPGLSGDALAAFSERVRTGIDGRPFAVRDSHTIHISVSIGYVAAPIEQWEAAITAADEALYRAKESGRNRSLPGTIPS